MTDAPVPRRDDAAEQAGPAAGPGSTTAPTGDAARAEHAGKAARAAQAGRPGSTAETAPASGLGVEHASVVYPATGRGRRRTDPLTAVDDVSLAIPTGTVLALLGPSGCGKSSLLRAVAGLEDLAAGAVTWDGRDVTRVPVHKRGFGLMFQDGQLFPFRDVAGNVAYGLTGLPRARREERVDEVLELVGLPGFQGRAVTTLSGGQAQRVALARSLAPRPRLLLLDEPLSALDRAMREELSAELRTILTAAGSTALYVTHDHAEAEVVSDRVGVMEAGRLIAVDTMAALRAAPGSPQVARFLGV